MRNDAFDFSPERKLYERLRPTYGKEERLFVPNTSHGLAGFVTFDEDAQRLRPAVEQLGLPDYIARTFQDDTVLWLIDANPGRVQTLNDLGGCYIYFAYHQIPADVRPQELDLPQSSG